MGSLIYVNIYRHSWLFIILRPLLRLRDAVVRQDGVAFPAVTRDCCRRRSWIYGAYLQMIVKYLWREGSINLRRMGWLDFKLLCYWEGNVVRNRMDHQSARKKCHPVCLQANLAFLIAVILPPAVWVDWSWLTAKSRNQMEIWDAKLILLFIVAICGG